MRQLIRPQGVETVSSRLDNDVVTEELRNFFRWQLQEDNMAIEVNPPLVVQDELKEDVASTMVAYRLMQAYPLSVACVCIQNTETGASYSMKVRK